MHDVYVPQARRRRSPLKLALQWWVVTVVALSINYHWIKPWLFRLFVALGVHRALAGIFGTLSFINEFLLLDITSILLVGGAQALVLRRWRWIVSTLVAVAVLHWMLPHVGVGLGGLMDEAWPHYGGWIMSTMVGSMLTAGIQCQGLPWPRQALVVWTCAVVLGDLAALSVEAFVFNWPDSLLRSWGIVVPYAWASVAAGAVQAAFTATAIYNLAWRGLLTRPTSDGAVVEHSLT